MCYTRESTLQGKHINGSARLKNYDYGQNGTYFVTICTKNQKHHFGDIVDGKMQYSDIGKNVCKYWQHIPNYFPFVMLDEWIVMPNHVHGIIIINKNDMVGAQDLARLRMQISNQYKKNGNKFGPQSRNIGSIIRGFKIGVTKYVRNNFDIHDMWQPRFYDHIIRTENALQNIRNYIKNNPKNWKRA